MLANACNFLQLLAIAFKFRCNPRLQAPSPRKPTKKSKRRKFAVDEGTGGRGDGATGANSGSAAAPRDSDDDQKP